MPTRHRGHREVSAAFGWVLIVALGSILCWCSERFVALCPVLEFQIRCTCSLLCLHDVGRAQA